jgi:anti-sigma factor RsiW
MLPERLTQLLTAYIDGELSTRQRRSVTKLLRKSPEARKLFKEMKQDSLILQQLPRQKMKQDLSQTLPGTIELRGLKLPAPPSVAAVRSAPVPGWLVALLALVLLGLGGGGSYLFFSGLAKRMPPAATAPAKQP